MNILETIAEKANELGTEKLLELLGVDMATYSSWFYKGKRFKGPSYEVCQKVMDLWLDETVPAVIIDQEKDNLVVREMQEASDDGSEASWSVDENGIVNGEYCPAEWGRKKEKWPGRDVCLCLPCYDDVPQAHHFIMMSMIAKYRMALRINFRGDDSMIARSRNHLAKRFLDTGATWSIWFDSDMVFPFGHAGIYQTMTNMKRVPEKFLGIHTIERLIGWGRTVVGGCYWDRRGGGRLIAGSRQAITHSIPADTLQAIDFNGTGCLAVNRQVFLDIAAKFPETLSADSMGNECGFFTPIQTPQRMLGEDESFAKRATDAGHPTYLDLGLLCGHVGRGNIHALPEKGSKV